MNFPYNSIRNRLLALFFCVSESLKTGHPQIMNLAPSGALYFDFSVFDPYKSFVNWRICCDNDSTCFNNSSFSLNWNEPICSSNNRINLSFEELFVTSFTTFRPVLFFQGVRVLSTCGEKVDKDRVN